MAEELDSNEYEAPEQPAPFEPAMYEVFEMPMMGFADMQAFESGSAVMWQCPGCAYPTYAEELPADYECPICGESGKKFIRVGL